MAKRLDGDLRTDQKAICAAADDPLAQIFDKPLWFWSAGEGKWINDISFTVGGGQPMHSCANQVQQGG